MSEAAKDKGIDEIMNMNIPPEDKVHFIGDLCKHRGKCMDEDAVKIHELETTIKQAEVTVRAMSHQLLTRSPWDNLMIWLNGWAKS